MMRRSVEGRSINAGPQPQTVAACCDSPKRRVLLGHLRAVGCAAALALARVLAFAAIVARFTSTLALTGVLTLARVLFLHLFVCRGLVRLSCGMHAGEKVGRLDRCGGTGEQTCESCASDEGLL